MKTRIILCVIGLLSILTIPSVLAYSQPTPTIEGVGLLCELGTLKRDSSGKVVEIKADTVVNCYIPIKVYEDALIVESALNQDFSFGYKLNNIDTENYYLVMYEAVDEESLNCNIIIYYNKLTYSHIITINYQNIYYRYYL